LSDDPCRAILRALAGLQLVEVGPTASEAIFLNFGPGGTRSLINEDADVEVAPAGGGPLIRYRRERSGYFRKDDRMAAIEATGTLVGQTVSSVEHGRHHRLTLRFAGGGAVRLRRHAQNPDWRLDFEPWTVQLLALAAAELAPWPRRDVLLLDDDGLLAVEDTPVVRVRAGEVIPRPTGTPRVADVLAALPALPLSGTVGVSLEFGKHLGVDDEGNPFAEASLVLGNAGLIMVSPGGEPVVLREPWAGVDFAELRAAVSPLIGRRPVAIDLAEDGWLTLAFEGGTRLKLEPTTLGDADAQWSVFDGASCRSLQARFDGSLVASSEWERGGLEPPVAVWGWLGVVRAPAYRPRPAPAPPRAVAPGRWSAILGGLVGQRVAAVEPGRPEARLRIAFDAKAALFADSCDVTVDDGAVRTLFHRTGRGDLSDRDATAVALRALAGRKVEGVEHGERNRLSVMLSDGGEIVFERARSELVDWRIIHRIDDLDLRALPVLSPQARPEDDDGALVLSSAGDRRLATFCGGLGRVTAADAVLGAAAAGSQLRRARALLAAPAGLALTEADHRGLEFGEPQPWRDGTRPVRPVWIQRGWADQYLRAPGERGDGRPVTAENHEATLAPLLGVRLAELTHEAPGRLVLAFEDGHRITLDPTVTPIPEWSVGLSNDGPWAAAMSDGSLRTMSPDQHIREAQRYVYGSLGAASAG
jgi:hypothetical protein